MAAAREQRWSQNIGLLVWLQRYEGIVDGQTVSVEFPLTTGTAFAVAKAGLMLSNRHVTSARDGVVPDDLSALGLPLLRSGKPALKVCFGADPSVQLDAKVLHESPDFDLAIVQVQREFAAPFTLSQGQIGRTDTVVALGYPGAVIELSQTGNPGHARQQLLAAMKSGQFRWLEFLPPDAFDFVATTGVVSAANRSMDGALYHMFDAKVAPGNSGGPLVASSTGEVVGIVTIGGTGPDASGYNFALALPQVRQELGRYLP
jgi:S1-C subfamily serine protease